MEGSDSVGGRKKYTPEYTIPFAADDLASSFVSITSKNAESDYPDRAGRM